MAWIQPELGWTDDAAPVGSDFNRMEGNDLENHNLILAESAARASADSTLQTNINNEASARVSADNTLQTNINNEASARASADSTLQTNINQRAYLPTAGGDPNQIEFPIGTTCVVKYSGNADRNFRHQLWTNSANNNYYLTGSDGVNSIRINGIWCTRGQIETGASITQRVE